MGRLKSYLLNAGGLGLGISGPAAAVYYATSNSGVAVMSGIMGGACFLTERYMRRRHFLLNGY